MTDSEQCGMYHSALELQLQIQKMVYQQHLPYKTGDQLIAILTGLLISAVKPLETLQTQPLESSKSESVDPDWDYLYESQKEYNDKEMEDI